MNKHPEPLFQKRNFPPPAGMINFVNIFITPPKTFQFDLEVVGKEIASLRSRDADVDDAVKNGCWAHLWTCHAILTPFSRRHRHPRRVILSSLILTLSTLYRCCQFLPLSDRIMRNIIISGNDGYGKFVDFKYYCIGTR